MPCNIPARPEQTEPPVQIDNHRVLKSEATVAPIQIINRALRDAALAPTVFDALDRCADALLQLAEISRAEVRHG